MSNRNMNLILENAIRIAVTAHAGQMDKGGLPYILHPLHLMSQMETLEDKIVAVLHDVTEDTDMTPDHLIAQGIPDYLVADLKLLDHDKTKKSYDEYIIDIKRSARATRIKLADMRHNSDLTRMHNIEEKHLKMVKKYHKATKTLKGE